MIVGQKIRSTTSQQSDLHDTGFLMIQASFSDRGNVRMSFPVDGEMLLLAKLQSVAHDHVFHSNSLSISRRAKQKMEAH